MDEALAVTANAPETEREPHVHAVLVFFHRELVPHAGAEEAVLCEVADRLAAPMEAWMREHGAPHHGH